MPFIIDAHEDLAWNMLTFGRDYTLSAGETRLKERGTQVPGQNGDTLLGWLDYQKGNVVVLFSTLFAAPARRKLGEWDTQSYNDFSQAHSIYRKQLDAYHRLSENHADKFRLILSQGDLDGVLTEWQKVGAQAVLDSERGPQEEQEEDEAEAARGFPVGLVILMEGAEGVLAPAELEEWWGSGVRIIGPAWAGTRFCGGTREPGPVTSEGFALFDAMAGLGFTLDISHMDENAVLQALDTFPGRIIASHANAQALLKGYEGNRLLSDQVIHGLLERDGLVGVVPLNSYLMNGWKRSDPRELVSLGHVVAQIDYICQIAGDAEHVGLGSDFDGGFGVQSVPIEINTIADLQKLVPLLAEKGYSETDIAKILGENWMSFLQESLPENT
jgi:membrane dipeptidase